VTNAEIRSLLLELICDIAPEADAASIADQEDIREAFDLDSMDFSNLVAAIHKRTGVNIPEVDYRKLFTLGGAIAYLEPALGRSGGEGK
jgi:acyl carrier protein